MNSIYKLFAPVLLVLVVAITTIYMGRGYILSSHDTISNDDGDDKKNDETSSKRSNVELAAGKLVVHIPREIQEQSNLQLFRLATTEYHKEIHAFARVVDIQSLLQLRSDYMEIQTEIATKETAAEVSSQEYKRLKLLRKEASNISERQLQQAKLDWMSNQSQLQATMVKKENIKNQILHGWGSVLSKHVLNNSDIATDLFNTKIILLLVTLESKQQLPANTNKIIINAYGNRKDGEDAYYLSPAPFTDNTIYGQSWFFYTNVSNLSSGIYLDAWIPNDADGSKGILIPSDAIIWYVDKPWVYIKTNEDTFVRREVKNYTISKDGWFVQSGFEPGEEIVLQGAQMLLSEEFRWSIPDEDDNP